MNFNCAPFTVDEVGFIQTALAKVLSAAAKGEIDLNQLAREELANRGQDIHGNWVGFEQARALLNAERNSEQAAIDIDEDLLAEFCSDRLENGEWDLEDIPRRMARYALATPQAMKAEMAERMEALEFGPFNPDKQDADPQPQS